MKPTQEQVIAWAREAGIKSSKSNGMFYTEYWDGVCPDGFVAAMTLAYEAGRKDENEAFEKELLKEEPEWLDDEAYHIVLGLLEWVRARG